MDKVIWLGQAGLLLTHQDCHIMIDPYLSDSVAKVNPQNHRRVPVDPQFFSRKPDVLIFTHDHLDHYDPETVAQLLDGDHSITVLAPWSVWGKVRAFGGRHNYVLFNRHTQWTQGDLCFTAVKAEHSDPHAIGVIVYDGKRKYYITGDTHYNEEIFPDLPKDIFAVFLPINGVGNNMNPTDAAQFSAKIGAQRVVPIHFGLFDAIDPRVLTCDNKIIPEIYKEVTL